MDIERLQKNWTNLGRTDPLWAILGREDNRGTKWDMDAFLRTGLEFADYLQRHLNGLEVQVGRQRALDFGCGYGRLTQALAHGFAEVVGVDIAPTMLEGARSIDRSNGRCRFVLNSAADLGQFGGNSFDFVLTVLVLQHMQPALATGYLREFLRVLRPGGVTFFQVPTEYTQPARRAGAAPSPATAPAGSQRLQFALSVHPGHMALHRHDWRYYRVHLHNLGNVAWCAGPGPSQVQIAHRWYNLEGTPGAPLCCHDLPHDVASGETLRMLVPVRAPGEAMSATLVFTVVSGRRWIESPQGAVARVVVQVGGGGDTCQAEPPPPPTVPGRAQGKGDDGEAVIEVYGVPVHEVVATVEAAGGEVIDAAEDGWAGPEWLSAHYTVRKRR